MILKDIYNLIEEMELTIGNDCRIKISAHLFGALNFKAEWLDEENIFTFVKVLSDQELKYIKDDKVWIQLFCHQAIRAYKIATIGEE